MSFWTKFSEGLSIISSRLDIWHDYLVSRVEIKKTIPIIIFFLLVVFQNPINEFLLKYIVDPILGKVDEYWFIDLIFLLFFLVILFLSYFKISKSIRDNKKICWWSIAYSLLLICSYLYLRLPAKSPYFFNQSIWFPVFAYFDVVIVALIVFILKFKPMPKDLGINRSVFFEDSPQTFKNLDLFNREQYSRLITNNTTTLVTQKAFAIGILGEWGKGKSFLLDKIGEHINGNNTTEILIRFDPWRYNKSEDVLSAFFKELIINVEPYNQKLSTKLSQYCEALKSINENDFTRAITGIGDLIEPKVTAEQLYEEIKDTLPKIGKRIHILIDDIDRLDKSEIMTVLKLIRNTVNFPNLIYYVAYDQNYLIEILEINNIPHSEEYLRKIFQMQVVLPENNSDTIFSEFSRLLMIGRDEANIDNKHREAIEKLKSLPVPNIFKAKENIYYIEPTNIFIQYFKNLRDVVRFVNQYNIEAQLVGDTVDILEFLLIVILKTNNLRVYYYLRDRIIIEAQSSHSTARYKLNKTRIAELDKEDDKITNQSTLNILSYLYDEKRPASVIQSVCYIRNHSLYFNYDKTLNVTYKQLMGIKDFALKRDYNGMSELYDSIDKIDLVNVLLDYQTYYSRQDFESTIDTLRFVYYRSLPEKQSVIADSLYQRLLPVDTIINAFYRRRITTFKTFVSGFLNNPEYPFLLECDLALRFLIPLLRNKDEYTPMSKDLLKRFILSCFEKFVLSNEVLSNIDFELFYRNYDSINSQTDIVVLNKAACRLLREKILKNDNNRQFYADSLIRDWGAPNNDGRYVLEPFIEAVWEGYDNFEEFILSLPENINNLELRLFYRNYKENKYRPITFQRQMIEITSDENTNYLQYNENKMTARKAVAFNVMDYTNDVIISVVANLGLKDPEFDLYSWIAHCEPKELPDHEATNGGEYVFSRKFEIPDNYIINDATLKIAVDDYCEVKLNNKVLLSKEVSKKHPVGFLHKIDIVDEKGFDQQNELLITVYNKSAAEIGHGDKKITYTDNIYWLVYGLQIQLTKK
jgi:hypothetical protein